MPNADIARKLVEQIFHVDPVGNGCSEKGAIELITAALDQVRREAHLECAGYAEHAAKEYADNGLTQPSEACAMLTRVYRALKREGK